jgi:hypothetical protein
VKETVRNEDVRGSGGSIGGMGTEEKVAKVERRENSGRDWENEGEVERRENSGGKREG